MELKPGYKQTEAGVIPEDWEVSPLGEIASLYQPVTISAKQFKESGFPVYGANGVVGFYNRTNHDSWQVTVTCRGSTCGTVNRTVDRCWITGNAMVLNCEQNQRLNKNFFYYMMCGQDLSDCITGTGQPQIVRSPLAAFAIALPPTLAEQEAIAEALSDADALIDSLEQLIAKKRLLKQGAMQDLLTGKKRLPGFEGDWEVTRMGEVLRFQAGFPFSSSFFNQKGKGLRLIRNRDLKATSEVTSYSGPFDSAFAVNDGDVLVGMDGEFIPCLWSGGQALLNQRIGRIIPKHGIDAAFAYYRLAKPLREIENATAGTTVKHLSHKDVEEIEIPLPSKSEQAAIAAILSDMDAEIAALEAKLAKARQVKQGMMQELLTGKTRLL